MQVHVDLWLGMFALVAVPYSGPELLVQRTGDQAALKQNAESVVAVGGCTILWCFLRRGRHLGSLCCCLVCIL